MHSNAKFELSPRQLFESRICTYTCSSAQYNTNYGTAASYRKYLLHLYHSILKIETERGALIDKTGEILVTKKLKQQKWVNHADPYLRHTKHTDLLTNFLTDCLTN